MKIYEHQSVAILGAGLTGLSLLRFCLKLNCEVTVMDSREMPPMASEFESYKSNARLTFGYFDSDKLEQVDHILVSPGVDLKALPIELNAIKSKISSDIEIFIAESSAPVVAITGSNGKSTVCDALGFVLNRIGKVTVVAGNIGTPVLDLLNQDKPDLYVLELSSFQLDLVNNLSASVACILNITEDHLDRHETMTHYVGAKQNIYQHASRRVYNCDDVLTVPGLGKSRSSVESDLTFGRDEQSDFRVIVTSDGFSIEHLDEALLSESEVKLKGFHNGLNIAAIFAILKSLNVPLTTSVFDAVKAYSGLEHRCQQIKTNDGILWVNDSKATNVGSAVSAILSYRPKCKTLFLIAGGDLKGANCDDLTITINQQVDEVWAYGKDVEILTANINKEKVNLVSSLPEAVAGIKNRVIAGDCVLLSPACASTDMYANYQERGNHFAQLLKEAS